LRAHLDSMVQAPPCPAPLLPVEPAPAVILLGATLDLVVPDGLFPHAVPSCRVLAPCTLSRTGFCVRPLVGRELWGLWDVPILLQDLALSDPERAAALSAVVESAPAKVLQLGGECLLAGVFRGGATARAGGRGEGVGCRARGKPARNGGLGRARGCESGPATEVDDTSASAGALSMDEVEESQQEPVGRWITDPEDIAVAAQNAPSLPVDVTFVLEGEDVSLLPVVVKGDDQKADDAATPTRLWAYFFKRSFLARFKRGQGPGGPWQTRGKDIYHRHAWGRRRGMPPDWERAMDGFRRLGLR
jgi:hypothetical protein